MNSSMVKCEQCGAICNIKDGYCKKCWKKLLFQENQPDDYIIDGIGQAELENFIDKNSDRYINVFKKNNGKKFFLNINWAAFFFGVNWLFYRKMYKFAIISFLVSCLLTMAVTAAFCVPYIDEIASLSDEVAALDTYLDNGGKTILTNPDGSTYSPDVVIKGAQAEDRINEINSDITSKSFLLIPAYCIFFGLFGDSLYKRYVFKNIKNKEGGTSISSLIVGCIALQIMESLIFSFILPLIIVIIGT